MTVGIDRADGVYGATDDTLVVGTGAGMGRRNVAGLVYKVKAEPLGRDALVPLGKHLPGPCKCVLRLLVTPEIVLFPVCVVDAKARRTVEIETGMQTKGGTGLDVAVDVLKDLLLGVVVVEIVGPIFIVAGDADEVKSLLCHKLKLLEVSLDGHRSPCVFHNYP